MKTKKQIFKKPLAELTREICEKLYEEGGATKVYDYANKIRLQYSPCKPCDAETPTISDSKDSTCAVCGTNKH